MSEKSYRSDPIKQDITVIESRTIIGKNSIFKHDIIPYLRIRHEKSQHSPLL